MTACAVIDLYWLPLGAGGHCVRWNGRAYERAIGWRERRVPTALYHSALVVTLPSGAYVVEQTPVPFVRRENHGAVAVGAVGMRWAGRWRPFRYEIRCWRNGTIADIDEAVHSPVRVTWDESACAAFRAPGRRPDRCVGQGRAARRRDVERVILG